MFFEGAPRLAKADLCIPLLRHSSSNRIALEAYPGYLAKKQLGISSYKSDEKRKQTSERKQNRGKILAKICKGEPLGIRLGISSALKQQLIDDPMGDYLDSTLCALQAAWGWRKRNENYGIPVRADPVEGWIVTVQDDDILS